MAEFVRDGREDFTNLCMVARRNGITFTKKQAEKWVGGRYALQQLISNKKIRVEKSGERQNAYCRCMAEDVLKYAFRIL
jgi:hypothetical protein